MVIPREGWSLWPVHEGGSRKAGGSVVDRWKGGEGIPNGWKSSILGKEAETLTALRAHLQCYRDNGLAIYPLRCGQRKRTTRLLISTAI